MNIKKLLYFVGKTITIHKEPNNFVLYGVIYEADESDNTIKFVTTEKASYINADLIIEITERARLPYEELCSCCGKCWYRKTSFDVCPYCLKEKDKDV